MIEVRVQGEAIDSEAELRWLEALGGGAVASFTGLVRADDGLIAMTLEHHPGLTHLVLRELAEAARDRWSLSGVVLVHRHGRMLPGDRIVFVGTAAHHRAAALEACAFLIDRAKVQAPFWKHEHLADGTSRWVEARAEDDRAAARW